MYPTHICIPEHPRTDGGTGELLSSSSRCDCDYPQEQPSAHTIHLPIRPRSVVRQDKTSPELIEGAAELVCLVLSGVDIRTRYHVHDGVCGLSRGKW